MPLVSTPWLSVIVPVFNGERYLAEAFASLCRAGVSHTAGVEIVVIDDASRDRSVELIQSFSRELPIRLVRRNENQGWVIATNQGLTLARGRYCSFLHQDDRWGEQRLRLIKASCEANPADDLLLTAARFISPTGRVLGAWTCPLPARKPIASHTLHERLMVQNFVAIGSPIFSHRLATEVGGLDPALWYTADWNFWLSLACTDTRVRYEPVPTYDFRIHPESQTARRSQAAHDFRRQLEKVLERHLQPSCDPTIASAARLSIDINCALAAGAHGQRTNLPGLQTLTGAGLAGVLCYFKLARLMERMIPRLRLRWSRRY